MQRLEIIPIGSIAVSKDNPRTHFDEQELNDLAASIKAHGILQPVVVRPAKKAPDRYELVFGERRIRAARLVPIDDVPVIVREMSDAEVAEARAIENLQRVGLDALDEADQFVTLTRLPGADVAKVAARVGRSPAYVYDRLRFANLLPAARVHYREGRLTAGHLVVLARLKRPEQKRALDVDTGGAFTSERTLFDPLEKGGGRAGDPIKPRTVRELQIWVDEHVRFDPAEADPQLFPETAEEVAHAQKVVPITFEYQLKPDVRSDVRTFTERSWKRADGKHRSKICPYAVTGCVVAGVHRGEAFAVCVAKEKCPVHWGAEIREREKRAAAREAALKKAGGKAPAAKGGKAATEPKRDPEMDAAIERGEEAGRDEAMRKLHRHVLETPTDTAMRIVFASYLHVIRDGLGVIGTGNTTEAAAKKWVDGAPLGEVIAAWVLGIVSDSYGGDDDGFAALFGVSLDAIEKKHRDAAIAELNAKRAAATPASAKPSKKKPTATPAGRKAKKAGAR